MKIAAVNYTRLGLNIRTRRLFCSLTQAEVAKMAGCSASTISKLERGVCAVSVMLLFRLANVLKCRASELVDGV